MDKKQIHRIVEQRLLEYASRNDEVAKQASWLSSLIEQVYNHINKIKQQDYEQIELFRDIQFNEHLCSNARRVVNSINWEPLTKPMIRTVELCPVEIFTKKFYHVVAIIIDIPKEDWAVAEQYRKTLASNISLGTFIPYTVVSFDIPSLLFFFTSSMIEDGDFESIVQHEVMHAFQHKIKKVKNGKIQYTDITSSSVQDLIEKLKPFKAQDENIKKLLRILYLLTPTEKSAWLHQISLELNQSALKAKPLVEVGVFNDINDAIESRYYDNMMQSFKIFEEYMGTSNKQLMIDKVSSYLQPYMQNHKKLAKQIIIDYDNYKAKVQKIVYQQKQQILDELS